MSTTARTKSSAKATSKPQAHQEDTRDRLIAAGIELFAKRGLDGVSVKELADSAGVNVSLVSYHFGGKDSLYRTCLEQFGKERLAVAQRLLQPPQTLEELRVRLKMFIEEMFACHLENRDTAQMVHRECEMDTPQAPDVFRNTFLKVFETMIEFIRSAQSAGIVRAELDVQFVTRVIFSGVIHTMRSDKITQKYYGLSIADPAYREKLIDHILQCSLFGIAAHSPPLERSNS